MPTLAVFHATGQQGSSVINNVLADPELSKTIQLRALTRDINSTKSKELRSRGVETVFADANDSSSVQKALTGADFAFVVTVPDFSPNAVQVEFDRAKSIADAAVAAGVEYVIFSTLSDVSRISGGKYKHVYAYDAKAKAEEYIKTLPIKSAFVNGAPFMQNFQAQSFLAPVCEETVNGGERYVWRRNMSPNARYTLLDAEADFGKFVTPILASPDKYVGKTFYAATSHIYTLTEISTLMSESTGKTVVYEQISDNEFFNSLKAFGDAAFGDGQIFADIFVDGFKFYDEFGSFGEDTAGKVKWSVENARGVPRGLDEYFKEHPMIFNTEEWKKNF